MKIWKRYIESLWIAPFCHIVAYGIVLIVALGMLGEMHGHGEESPRFDPAPAVATFMFGFLLFSSYLGWVLNVIWRVTHGKWASTIPSILALLLFTLVIFAGMIIG